MIYLSFKIEDSSGYYDWGWYKRKYQINGIHKMEHSRHIKFIWINSVLINVHSYHYEKWIIIFFLFHSLGTIKV